MINKMLSLKGQKGVIHFLPLLAIVGAVAFLLFAATTPFGRDQLSGLFVKTPSEAAESKSSLETAVNPYGDSWSTKKTPNSGLAVSLGVPNITSAVYQNYPTVPQEQIDFLAKTNAPFLYMDSLGGELQGGSYVTATLPKLKDEITRIKFKNPQIKVIGYVVFNEGHLIVNETKAKADNPFDPERERFEKFFVHKAGKPETKENRVNLRPDHPEWGALLFDITNPDYRAYIIPKMVAAMNDMQLDGVMADGMFLDALGVLKNDMPQEKVNAWPAAMAQFAQELKAAMGSKYLFGNVSRAELSYVRDTLFAPGRLDGILLEDPFGRSEQVASLPAHEFAPGHETWDQTLAMLNMVNQKNKHAIVIVNTNINGMDSSILNESTQKRFASYYLAAYLQLYQANADGSLPAKQMFLHYTPSAVHVQFNSAAFFKDWDLNLGLPTSASKQVEPNVPGVFVRTFQNGYVFINTTYSNYEIKGGSGLYSSFDGSEIRAGAVVPAKSGRFYVTRAAYEAWKGAPPPGTIASPSPVPVFTPNPPQPGSGQVIRVNRLVYRPTGLRFWTINQDEVSMLTSGGWTDEGVAYYAYSPYAAQPSNVVGMYRLKNPADGSWFWTINMDEVDLLVRNNWINEGVAYYVHSPYNSQPANTQKVYRVYDRNAGKRFWTTNVDEVNYLVSQGLINEGTAFYTPNP